MRAIHAHATPIGGPATNSRACAWADGTSRLRLVQFVTTSVRIPFRFHQALDAYSPLRVHEATITARTPFSNVQITAHSLVSGGQQFCPFGRHRLRR